MSDAWGSEYDENEVQLDGPRALREAYEAQKRQNKELQEGLAAIRNELRQQKLSSVFNDLGVPQASSLYSGDADPDKAREWVESMKSVFGGANAPSQPTAQPAAPVLSNEQQNRYQQISAAGSDGQPIGNMDAAALSMGNANNIQDLINAFKGLQG